MLLQLGLQLLHHAGQKRLALLPQRIHLGRHLLIRIGVGIPERQVFELAAQLAHAQPMCQRSVDIQRLLGDLLLLFGLQVLQRPHIMKPVRQLDNHHANIGHHRQQHLANILGLVVLAIGKLDLVQLGDALDNVRHLVAELHRDLRRGDIRVLNRVMQQPRCNRRRIHPQLGQHLPDLKRMNDIRLPTRPLLPLMLLQAELPRLADNLEIVPRPVGPHRLQQMLKLFIHRPDIRLGAPLQMRRRRISPQRQRRWRCYKAPTRLIQIPCRQSRNHRPHLRQSRFHLDPGVRRLGSAHHGRTRPGEVRFGLRDEHRIVCHRLL